MKRIPLPTNHIITMPNKGEYYIDELIGEGGFSLVYHAHTKGGKTKVVLKEFFPAEYACRDINPLSTTYNKVIPISDEYRELFQKNKNMFNENEGRFGGELLLESSQVVAFSQSGDGYAVLPRFSKDMYTILDLVQYWEKNPFSGGSAGNEDITRVAYSLKIIDSILDVIATFHSNELLHLDLSATNILFATKDIEKGRNGRAYLIDFGSAVRMNNGIYFSEDKISYSDGYSAPEIFSSKAITVKADLYSIGAILYFLCIGKNATIDWQLLKMTFYDIEYEIGELQMSSKIKKRLIEFLKRACDKKPENRYATALKMQEDVRKMLDELELDQTTCKILDTVNTFVVKPHTIDEGTYVVRNEELNCIDEILHNGISEKGYCLIKGIGGSGKTELAKAYAWTKRANYKKVFMLTCPETFDGEYDILSLLVNSKYTIRNESFNKKIAEELFLNFDNTVLIIIDNCNKINNNFIRAIEEKTGKADVIITTRNGSDYLKVVPERILEIGNNNQQLFAFDVFCKNYFVNDKKEIRSEDKNLVIDVCRMAMYNPLLLSMIAIQCREFGLGFSELRRRMSISLENAELDGAEIVYDNKEGTISELMKIYFSDILYYDFTKFQKVLLTVLCMMPAEQINARFLFQILGDVPEKCVYMKSACDKLRRLNWIQKSERFVSIHPLLAEVLQLFGDDRLIVKDERKGLCNHLLQNWLSMSETTQKEDKFFAHILWKEIKEEDKYKETNLMMSAVLDKTLIKEYWNGTLESKKYPNAIFCTIKYEYGSTYGIWDIQKEKYETVLDLKYRRNRYWGSDYCIEIENYENAYATLLYLYLTDESHLRLPNKINGADVLRIEEGFARNNKNIHSIIFPPYLKEIGRWAFGGSTVCGELVLPETVNEIGEFAFASCKQLYGSLVLPKQLKKLGCRCFVECSGFNSKLHLPENIERLEEGTFSGCSGIVSIRQIPESICYIGRECFCGCKNLKGEINIPSKIKIIHEYTFYRCEEITRVNFSIGLNEIRDGAFWGCVKLNYFKFFDNLKKISDFAFRECSNLKFQLVLPNSLCYIGHGAFLECGFVGDLILPEKLEFLGSGAFDTCTNLTGTLKVSPNLKVIKEHTFSYCGFTGTLSIPEGVEIIDEFAFSHCNKITSVNLPNTLESVGNGVFWGCHMLNGDVKVPSGIKQWGCAVFEDCGAIGDLILPCNVSNISDLINIIINKSDEEYLDEVNDIFYDDGMISCDWEDERTWISAQSRIKQFFDEHLNIRPSIIKIEEYEFKGNRALKGQITFNNSCLQSIGEEAFRDCEGLCGTLQLPESLKTIGRAAFWGCEGLCGTLQLPESLKTIGCAAFGGCENLDGKLVLPDHLKVIEEYSFYKTGFSGVLKLPSQLRVIGLAAFQNCSNFKGELYIPPHTIKIGMKSFAGCSGLEGTLIIPESVEVIEADAFRDCRFTKIVFMSKDTKILRPIIGSGFGSDIIIVGKKNSTAYVYAQQFNCPFEPYNRKYDFK